MKLTPEQQAVIEAHSAAHHDSRHHLAVVEKVRAIMELKVLSRDVCSAELQLCTGTGMRGHFFSVQPCSSWLMAWTSMQPTPRHCALLESRVGEPCRTLGLRGFNETVTVRI
jgi:hypothetical protein